MLRRNLEAISGKLATTFNMISVVPKIILFSFLVFFAIKSNASSQFRGELSDAAAKKIENIIFEYEELVELAKDILHLRTSVDWKQWCTGVVKPAICFASAPNPEGGNPNLELLLFNGAIIPEDLFYAFLYPHNWYLKDVAQSQILTRQLAYLPESAAKRTEAAPFELLKLDDAAKRRFYGILVQLHDDSHLLNAGLMSVEEIDATRTKMLQNTHYIQQSVLLAHYKENLPLYASLLEVKTDIAELYLKLSEVSSILQSSQKSLAIELLTALQTKVTDEEAFILQYVISIVESDNEEEAEGKLAAIVEQNYFRSIDVALADFSMALNLVVQFSSVADVKTLVKNLKASSDIAKLIIVANHSVRIGKRRGNSHMIERARKIVEVLQ